VANIAKDSTEIVRLQWTDKTMSISAASAEAGEAMLSIPVMEGSMPGKIALKLGYLFDYLVEKEGFYHPGNQRYQEPCRLHLRQAPYDRHYAHVVQWPGEPQEEPKLQEESAASSEASQEPASDEEGEPVVDEETGEVEETGQEDDSDDTTSVEYTCITIMHLQQIEAVSLPMNLNRKTS